MSSEALFQQVVAKLGLAMILAPGTLKRSLKSVGADWETAQKDDYRRMLPNLEARLCSYMEPAEAEKRIQEIRRLLDD